MAGCHLSYTGQQQSAYPQVCPKFFKRIRKVQLLAGLLVLPLCFYKKSKLCLLFSDAIHDNTKHLLLFLSSTNKTRKGNQVCFLSSLVPLNPFLPWCFITGMNSDGLSLLSVGLGLPLVFGDSSLS